MWFKASGLLNSLSSGQLIDQEGNSFSFFKPSRADLNPLVPVPGSLIS